MDLNKRGFVVLVIGFVVLLELCLLASANVVFQVQHKFAGNKRSLTQFKAHDSDRHRRILSAVDLPIGGDGSPTSAALVSPLSFCIYLLSLCLCTCKCYTIKVYIFVCSSSSI